ncbi:MAG: hypothetical protein ACRESK_04985 [Gammaproteobacteria bacterium]
MLKRFGNLFIFVLLWNYLAGLPVNADGPPDVIPIRNVRDMLDTRNNFVTRPTFADFSVCYGNTCRFIAVLGLDLEQWSRIRGMFGVTAASPAEEREQIRAAVSELEKITGDLIGTAADRGENLNGLGLLGQMDCVDEATNTTVYLTMMQVDNLLRLHTVELRTSRGLGSLQVPHFTAVIRDKSDDMRYAVDSWFLDNGQPPFIVPLPVWEKGWKPQAVDSAVAGKENP